MLLDINQDNPQQRKLDQAVECLKRDGVLIYPTDTVYGIGCNLFSKKAIQRIQRIKDMDAKKPMSFICSSMSMMQEYTQGIPNDLFKILKRLLPGPYTFILKASKEVPKIMLTKRETLGVRFPDNPIAIGLVETLGNPILSSSLRADETQLYENAYELSDRYQKQVDMIIDGGTVFAENSTIIDFTGDSPVLVRQGKGDASWLEEIYG